MFWYMPQQEKKQSVRWRYIFGLFMIGGILFLSYAKIPYPEMRRFWLLIRVLWGIIIWWFAWFLQKVYKAYTGEYVDPEATIFSTTNTQEEMDIFWRIPSVLIQHYDSLKNHTISKEKTINEFTYYSEYIYTTSTSSGKNKSTYDSNKALFLVYTRTEQFPFLQSYLYITADNNESLKSQILKYTIGPLTTFWALLYILEEWFFESLAAVSQYISVHQWVIMWMITLLSSFIGSLIRKKINSKHTVTLENKQIEKLVDVKSNDPIFARQICNPQFVETLHNTLEKEKLWWWTEVYIDTKQQKVFVKIDYLQKGFSFWPVNQFISLPKLSNFTNWNNTDAPKTEEIDKREGIFSQLLKSLKLTHAMRIISAAASITQDHTQIENNPLPIDSQQSLKIWKIIKRLIIAWCIVYLLSISPYLYHFLKTGDLSYRNGSFEIPSSNANPIHTNTPQVLPVDTGKN